MSSKTYSQKYLIHECREIQASKRHAFHPELTLSEKALIYKYSDDGYLKLNEKLRSNKGKNTAVFGKLLVKALGKLNDYSSLTYRKVQLTRGQQNIYKKASDTGLYVKEPAFSSTSKIKDLAILFPGNTLFIINSKTGKDIEKIAKFGYEDPYNEYEVLFLPNREFEVLEIDDSISDLLLITMEEI